VLPAGSTGSIGITGLGLQAKFISVNVVNPGQITFGVSPTSVTFTQNGSATPGASSVAVVTNAGTIPNYTTAVAYGTGTSGWLTVSPTPGVPSNSNTVTLTPNTTGLTTGTYTATVTLTTGTQTASIPVTLSINQTTGTPLTVSTSSLTFTGTQTTQQFITVTSGTPVAFTPSLSQNLAGVVSLSGSNTTNTTLTVTANPQAVAAGTSGTLTLTPTEGSGYSPVNIAININPSGLSTLVVNPTGLSFTAPVGGINVPTQSVAVTSADGTQRQFQVTINSGFNFLTVNTPFSTTPANVTVGINTAAITQPGTYLGSLAFTPLTGGGNTIFVPVTLNATQNVVVTPDPASVTLTTLSGSTVVQRDVLLNSSLSNVPFTASVSTTTGTWLSVVTSSNILPATISIIANPTGLAVGTYTGSVVIANQGVTLATIPVTLTVSPAATLQLSPSTLTFNYETSGTQPAAQTVQVTAANGANIPWNAAIVSSGTWLQINPTSGTTPGTINVSVTPTGLAAGTYTGSITVASTGASNSPQTVNVTLNVATPAVPLVTSFQNAGSFEQTLAVPGTIITIRGTDLGPTTGVGGQINDQNLATKVADVEVLFDGILSPLVYVSATQINAVVPYEVYGRTTTRLQVRYRNQQSRDLELRVQDTNPGLFTSNTSGSGQAAALNQNSTANGPANPEQRGNIIVLYATGMGQTSPGGATGRIMSGADLRRPLAPVTVRIGGQTAEVQYAGSAPGLVAGAVQINARIPQNSIIGQNVPVQVQIGSATSQGNVTIAVQ
jgi:uncharacterized protein (TIGR03437 family)